MTEPTPPVVPWEAPPEVAGPAPGIEFAGHGPRLVAYLIDGVLLTVLMVAVFGAVTVALFPDVGDRSGVSRPSTGQILGGILIVLVALIVAFGYFPFFWARGGQTPGMKPFGLRVVRDQDGGDIGWGTATLRVVGMYVASSVFYLGFIWIFIDKRRRGWHDLIAGTVVIKR
ncbi:MAG TPA: RDD family protein [Candidatus Saccharimonadales bacterium]|nr:RDD family protein [Candidatus Saccharimonadales bacterium]